MGSKFSNFKPLAAAAILSLAPLSAMAEDWKFAIEDISGSVMDVYAQEFKSRIEAATNGEVTVTVFPKGTLGSSTDIVEQTADGVVQFTHVVLGNLGTIVPESQMFLLPYLLPSEPDQVSEILSSSETIYVELNKDFQKRGLEIMSMYSLGPQVWTTNREVRSPEDLANFKMRVMVSPILLEAYKNMGASPTPLPFGEVFGALQLGAVDGQINPISTIEEMKFYEVTSHLIWAGEQELISTVVSGSDWFETLSPDRQQLVRDTIAEMTGFIDAVVVDFNDKRLDVITETKPDIELIVLTDEERDVFRARSEGTASAYIESTGPRGQELLEALQSEIAATN